MSADKKAMEIALKVHCVPVLRKLGFKGSFPNFYRNNNDFISLVNFQFFSSGGSFCVNLSYADPQRRNVSYKPDADYRRLRVMHTHARGRIRLGAKNNVGDHWFHFGKTSYDQFRDNHSPVAELALTCSKLLETDAEQWWRDMLDAQS
ncbi:DUF4304 domain-containing protein [uncultured Thioclava sp.]|uniref:DUF4304 domain-containing protein n=1 Tax=uncultured Thioclava sp. TaxID=473858 RepID=UPI0025EBB420|nr:DUF4304 domain-containing protein [uncultured Thioclava sp.]